MYGQLPICGNGELKEYMQIGSEASLKQDSSKTNQTLLASMGDDEFETELHRLKMEDARLGRITTPVPVSECYLSETKLHPRFGVAQGLKPNGEQKVRAVDNMSWGLCKTKRI